MDWRFFYSIGMILRQKCLKWACMINFSIYNTISDGKKGRELKYRFDFWPLKVRNLPKLLVFRRCATYYWKNLDKGYNFVWNLTLIKGLHKLLWASKVGGGGANFENCKTPNWESRKNTIWMYCVSQIIL